MLKFLIFKFLTKKKTKKYFTTNYNYKIFVKNFSLQNFKLLIAYTKLNVITQF